MGSDGLSTQRRQKEAAMLSRAELRFLAELAALRQRMEKAHLKETVNIERAIGQLQKKHPRVARFYTLRHAPMALSMRPATKRAGSGSKVMHQSAEGAAPNAPSPPIVNNFARRKMWGGDKLSQSVSTDGGDASDGTRSCYDHIKTVRRRTPVRSQASIARSDRTKAHEAPSASLTRSEGQSLRRKATSTQGKRINMHHQDR
jgi:hypothetical protein